MAKAKLFAADGSAKGELDLPSSHFEQEISESIMHLAVEVFLANQRQGTAKTKGRSEVSGGGKKPWKQKGTGRARAGSNTSPIWARGGKAHGPQPRGYHKDLNRKMRRKAFLSALSLKASENSVYVFEALGVEAPKTKALVGILKTAALEGRKNLILVNEPDGNLLLAARNIPDMSIVRIQDVNTYALLNATNVIFTDAAIKALGESRIATEVTA